MFGSLTLCETMSSQAVALMPARRPISPGEVLGLANQQTVGCSHSTPESCAQGAQIFTVLGVFTKCQTTLMVGIVDRPRQGLREQLRLDWLIQQALTVAIVQEAGDHEGRAGRPWLLLVKIRQGGRHHVGAPVGTVDLRTQLGIIMRHVEDVAWREDIRNFMKSSFNTSTVSVPTIIYISKSL